MATRYPADGRNAVEPRPLVVGERLKFDGDNRWWTVQAVTENFAALTRQAEFKPKGVRYYTVIDWRNGIRGACDLVGQSWGDGTYTEAECAEMLAAFETPRPGMISVGVEVSQRNWVPLRFAGEPATFKHWN